MSEQEGLDFTGQARKVLSLAQLEAKHFQHDYVSSVLALMSVTLLLLSISLSSCVTGGSKNTLPSSPSAQSGPVCAQPQPASGKLSLAGLAYGPSHLGQDPTRGTFPSSEEIEADMPTLASLTHYIRTYSSTSSADTIVQAAEAARVCVALGIGLGSNPTVNAREMVAGERLASNPAVHAIIVGNEVLRTGDLSEGQLRSDIEQVRARLGRAVPLTTAEPPDQWLKHPALAKVVDFITVQMYPFWQGKSINTAIDLLDQEYQKIEKAFPGKRVVVGETGWPSAGPSYRDAVPGAENQARYLRAFIDWAQVHRVQYFYFDAFDEDWKVKEHGVGTHWGLYQQDGQVKPALSDLLPAPAPLTLKMRSYRDIYVGGLETGFSFGMETSGQQRQWLTARDGSLVLTYPAKQQWGVMFISVGRSAPPGHRPSIDLSAYRSLVVDLRAAVDGQCVHIGIKDKNQPDNGGEVSVQRCLTTQWSTITLPLNAFTGVDLTHLYIVFELLFQGSSSTTVYVRNIRYSPS
jgi:exo-beta-1,3-glucanase (GH17 family)